VSLFRRERRAFGDTLADVVEAQRGGPLSSGVPVNDEQAMRLSAVWGCVDLIAELVSTLPLDVYRSGPDGLRIPVTDASWLEDPAGDSYGREVWCRQFLMSQLLRGNLYGWVVRLGGDGHPRQVEILHPDEVRVVREHLAGPLEWKRDNKTVERWPAGPLWHVPAYTVPGTPIGLSPIRYAAETIGLGLATHRYGAQWFRDGAHPTHVFESEQTIDQPGAE
jgi:HK97 family phage portal protein